MTNMQERMRQLCYEVEWRISQYHIMQREVRAYEEACMKGTEYHVSAEYIQSNRKGDPTALGALHLLQPGELIREMRDWLWAIDKARDEMHHFAPDLEKILVAFLLPKKREKTGSIQIKSNKRYELMHELNIGQTTLYNRKNACIEWIKALALYKGLLDPQLGTALASNAQE